VKLNRQVKGWSNYFDSLKKEQPGKPDAGKPHVRFDEGEAFCPLRVSGNLSTLLEKTAFENIDVGVYYTA